MLNDPRLPVTLLSGFLGAGKTTVLNHLLSNPQGRRLGVIVNDLSPVNIDAGLIVRNDHGLVELSNGCICCTLREELVAQIAALARAGSLDALLIESTGVSEPLPVAQGFLLESDGVPLSQLARVDTLVTVVDASTFAQDFATLQKVEDRDSAAPVEDRRNVVDLLVDQIEFADVLVLNKTDLASKRRLAETRLRLKALNPQALVIETVRGALDPSVVVASRRFGWEASQSLPSWQRELTAKHVPETLEYGIANFSLVSEVPFHPGRLYRFFAKRRPALLRAKGWFTLATQPGFSWLFHLAGRKKTIEFAGRFTGRHVELVFIGLWNPRQRETFKKELEACLLRPGESVGAEQDPFASYLEAAK
ncbi:MAG: GTP-binding protein [Spirochaetales bacterium]